jgi:hypothetical protein
LQDTSLPSIPVFIQLKLSVEVMILRFALEYDDAFDGVAAMEDLPMRSVCRFFILGIGILLFSSLVMAQVQQVKPDPCKASSVT